MPTFTAHIVAAHNVAGTYRRRRQYVPNNHGTYRRQSSKQEVKLRADDDDDDDDVIKFDLLVANTDSRSNTNSGDQD